jgi:hypothetical protein
VDLVASRAVWKQTIRAEKGFNPEQIEDKIYTVAVLRNTKKICLTESIQ